MQYHDLLEVLGFTEAAGNFEAINGGPGGLGGDSVQLNAQDGSGMNNANFRTPPDGPQSVPPRMRMYLWDVVPGAQRDGDFDQGIIIHEVGTITRNHGLSLTYVFSTPTVSPPVSLVVRPTSSVSLLSRLVVWVKVGVIGSPLPSV